MSTIETPSPGMGSMVLQGLVKLSMRVGTFALSLTALVATLLYIKQDSMLYFPEIQGLPRRPEDNPAGYRSPDEHEVSSYDDVYIVCDDNKTIHAWLILRTKEKNNLPTLIFFHGNAGNIGLRIPNALHMLQHLNSNILMVEYRGYGNSDSVKPTEAGLKKDAQAALKFISKHPKIDASKLFIFGRSLGGAVAFDLAQYAEENNIPLAGVIVENTFLSIAKMVDQLMPMIAPLKSLVLRIGWNSCDIVPKLTLPVLYLAGRRDELVPHSHMLDLFKATTKSRLPKIHIIKRGTHNETWLKGGQAYWDAIKSFMAEAQNAPGSIVTSISSKTESSPVIPVGTDSDSSIPIMPSGLMGLARESMRDINEEQASGKKKEL
ncbi:unnamed protein product [Cylindrotheca closterium]|uniref:Serine aminopeptidase S33 domain-containing protein n=1 Tax=Cylindrotheca closterium TaxID=2856 RepID=A0AAD2CNX3_9STRA|nr:unnamed protein product [Cylindrotheca closterium]